MKLKTKLTISSVLLIVVAIAVCCALIVRFAWDRALLDTVSSALSDTEQFYSSLCNAYYQDLSDEQIVQRSYIIHKFRSVPGSNEFTLSHNGEYLCNNVGFAPENLLENGYSVSESGVIRYKNLRIDGVSYLIAGRTIEMNSQEYSICLVRDISELTSSITALAVKCALTGAVVLIITALLMWIIVFRSLKPVEKLKAGASELAQGNYEKRIDAGGRDELAELAADFNSMADAIEANITELNDKTEQLHERSQRQQMFINDLSHEMKTPVTAILIYAETLLNRKVSPEVVEHSLNRIYDQGKWLERLSQKLMALVMLQKEIELQNESVTELVEAVRATTDGSLRERNMALLTECSMDTLPMDMDLMRSALTNLVENAKRASRDGQTIILCAHDHVIEVTDHGKGIPKEEITRITEPFYMVDRSRSKQYGGSGLGMALVQRIAEAHGAELQIESVEHAGTTVRLVFPANDNKTLTV